MKKIFLALMLLTALAATSCSRRCHCYGYDGSHTYFTSDELSEMGTTCVGMEEYMYGFTYSLCEYDFTNY